MVIVLFLVFPHHVIIWKNGQDLSEFLETNQFHGGLNEHLELPTTHSQGQNCNIILAVFQTKSGSPPPDVKSSGR